MILRAFFMALGQMPDPKFRAVLIRGIGLTIALLIAVTAIFVGAVDWLVSGQVMQDLFGEVTWLGDLISWASLLLMIVLSVFLMIPVASAITSLFLDEVAAAVENRHYPALPPVPAVPFWDGFKDTVNFMGVLIVANIAALLIYGLLLATVVLSWAAPLVFVLLNGFLLGREYFQIAAMRRLGRDDAIALRAQHRGKIWLAGCLMTLPLMVPLLNLIVPVLGAATFTHLFHQLGGQAGASRPAHPDRAN